MRLLDHPNIVRFVESFEDRRCIYIALELCLGGELFERICRAGCFTEDCARPEVRFGCDSKVGERCRNTRPQTTPDPTRPTTPTRPTPDHTRPRGSARSPLMESLSEIVVARFRKSARADPPPRGGPPIAMQCVPPPATCETECPTGFSAPGLWRLWRLSNFGPSGHLGASCVRRRHGAVAADGRAGDDEAPPQWLRRGFSGGRLCAPHIVEHPAMWCDSATRSRDSPRARCATRSPAACAAVRCIPPHGHRSTYVAVR